MPKFSQRSIQSLEGVHPDLVRLMTVAIKTSPVDFTITKGVRTTEEQIAEYRKGRRGIKGEATVTAKDGVKKKSNHQVKADGYGHAVDLYPYYNKSVQVQEAQVPAKLAIIAKHIKTVAHELNIRIGWGGDWAALDMPHFELL